MTGPRRLLAAAALVLGLLAPLLPVPAAAAADACAPDPVLCPERLLVGVSAPGLPYDTTALQAFATAAGHQPGVAMWFQQLGTPLDPRPVARLVQQGRLPMVTLEPLDLARPGVDAWPLAAIARGDADDLLRADARAIATAGGPVAVRFAHEMNGGWYPWGAGVGTNTPADYVAAYRHVHDVVQGVLAAAGTGRVVWTWSPNLVDSSTAPDLAPFWPGAAYVDWVGLSAYEDEPGDSFASLFPPTLAQLDRVAPATPVYVAETAVLPSPDRAARVHDLVTGMLGVRRLVGFTWFDRVSRYDWRLENDPAASAQLATELASGWWGAPGQTALAPVAPWPQLLPPPAGGARVGQLLHASYGTWRTPADSGPVTWSGRWYRCTSPTDPAACTATSATNLDFTATVWDLRRYLRFRVTAANSAGTTTAWGQPTRAVLTMPATPAAPEVEARDGALRVVFPPAPPYTTHWQVLVDGVTQPWVAVGSRTDTWVTGLVDGAPHLLSLSAVCAAGTDSVASAPTAGTVAALPLPGVPYVAVRTTGVTVQLPRTPPAGATGWQVSVDDAPPVALPLTAVSYAVPPTALVAGRSVHSAALRTVTGSWPGRAYGARTPPSTATFSVP